MKLAYLGLLAGLWGTLALAQAAPAGPTVEATYPGLSMGPLRNAQLAALPQGIVLLAGKVAVNEREVSGYIAKADAKLRPKLQQNGFYVLEEIGTRAILLGEAKDWATAQKRTAKETDDALITAYLGSVAEKATVTDAEVRAYYDQNKELFGDAKFEEVATDLKSYLRSYKQQGLINEYISSMSQRVAVQVNSTWVKGQAATALDNPIDKARRSGTPTLVEFTMPGCQFCEREAPIIEEMRETFAGKLNVVIVDVTVEPILAARFGIRSVPVQGYFDKAGKEVRLHDDFSPREDILQYLGEIGVK